MFSKSAILRLVVWVWFHFEVEGANILALPVSKSYSHFIVIKPLLEELANRGHNLTIVSSFPRSTPRENYHDIYVGHVQKPVQNNLSFEMMMEVGKDPFTNTLLIWNAGVDICKDVLQPGVLLDLYNSSQTFDLVITHIFTYECFNVFAYRFNAPIVSMVTSSALPWSNSRIGNPNHPAYVVNNFIDAHEQMSLFQRVVNSLAWLLSVVGVNTFNYGETDKLVRQYLDPSAPPNSELVKRTSLILVNSHFTLLQSRPFVPNMVEVAGIHIQEPKPLDKDLQEFLDDAQEGAIIFSLGSVVRASSMSNDTFHAFMDAFATLPQRVVFKLEDEREDIPPNVLLRKWLPQRDLLEHPRVKVLMAHGGQASTIEAVYTATPLIGMPLFSDQYSNIEFLVLKGAAVLLDLRHISKDTVLDALHRVLKDPSYNENAKRLSREFRDRPLSPLDTAVYWTEYVLRHRGAPQLRSKVADLPWFKFLLLDVAAVFLTCIIGIYYIFKLLIKYVLHYFWTKYIAVKFKSE